MGHYTVSPASVTLGPWGSTTIEVSVAVPRGDAGDDWAWLRSRGRQRGRPRRAVHANEVAPCRERRKGGRSRPPFCFVEPRDQDMNELIQLSTAGMSTRCVYPTPLQLGFGPNELTLRTVSVPPRRIGPPESPKHARTLSLALVLRGLHELRAEHEPSRDDLGRGVQPRSEAVPPEERRRLRQEVPGIFAWNETPYPIRSIGVLFLSPST